jgi:formylmethanofuran dehydrogenase subunit C
MALVGREQRRVKIVIDGEVFEQVQTFRYLGCRIKTDLEEIIGNYNKLN